MADTEFPSEPQRLCLLEGRGPWALLWALSTASSPLPPAEWEGGRYLRRCLQSHCPCWAGLGREGRRPWGSVAAATASLWR